MYRLFFALAALAATPAFAGTPVVTAVPAAPQAVLSYGPTRANVTYERDVYETRKVGVETCPGCTVEAVAVQRRDRLRLRLVREPRPDRVLVAATRVRRAPIRTLLQSRTVAVPIQGSGAVAE